MASHVQPENRSILFGCLRRLRHNPAVPIRAPRQAGRRAQRRGLVHADVRSRQLSLSFWREMYFHGTNVKIADTHVNFAAYPFSIASVSIASVLRNPRLTWPIRERRLSTEARFCARDSRSMKVKIGKRRTRRIAACTWGRKERGYRRVSKPFTGDWVIFFGVSY